jgi:hypothetical protein
MRSFHHSGFACRGVAELRDFDSLNGHQRKVAVQNAYHGLISQVLKGVHPSREVTDIANLLFNLNPPHRIGRLRAALLAVLIEGATALARVTHYPKCAEVHTGFLGCKSCQGKRMYYRRTYVRHPLRSGSSR